MILIISWLASIGSIIGNFGVIKKKLWGIQIWTIATGLWIIYAIVTHTYSQLLMFVIYEILNIYGWYEWKDSKKKSKLKENNIK